MKAAFVVFLLLVSEISFAQPSPGFCSTVFEPPLTHKVDVENIQSLGEEAQSNSIESFNYVELTPNETLSIAYPKRAIRLRQCGEVKFSLSISSSGTVDSVEIISPESNDLSAAVSTEASAWSFRITRQNANKGPISVNYVARFRLFEEDGAEIKCEP